MFFLRKQTTRKRKARPYAQAVCAVTPRTDASQTSRRQLSARQKRRSLQRDATFLLCTISLKKFTKNALFDLTLYKRSDIIRKHFECSCFADVAKLADAQVSGSCGRPCRFKSCHPHQKQTVISIQTYLCHGLFFLPSFFIAFSQSF